MPEEKTFKVFCAHCERPFRVRFAPVSEESGESEVAVNCMYCAETVMIALPRKYVRKEHLTRGLKSVASPPGAHAPSDND